MKFIIKNKGVTKTLVAVERERERERERVIFLYGKNQVKLRKVS